MAIVQATSAFKAVLIGLTLAPFGRRRRAPDVPHSALRHRFARKRDLPLSMLRARALNPWRRVLPDAFFRDTLERLPLAMITVTNEGRIDFVNASAERLFGYGRRELIGEQVDTIVPGACRAADIDESAVTLFARRKDQSQFLAEVTSSAIESGDGPRALAVVIDRTERDELQRNCQELAHLTRVSMLGELAASLAHELNQPLTAILSNAQAAQRFMGCDPIDLDEVREILRDLVADNNRANEILRRIRALVRKGELELAPLSIAGVIGDVALLVHSDAIQRGIRVTLDIDPQLPLVRGDKVQLQQVLLNLLLNAFDAMDESDAQRIVSVTASRESESMVRVSVHDEGHGVPAAFVDQLFRPFCTSKHDGLGLGLSISRSIVEMHGGRIWARNNLERGATFCFTLPTEDTPPSGGAHRAMKDIGPLVFIVDDDDSVRRALMRLIGAAGYCVEAFASAQVFLDVTRVQTGPACLMLDVQLPGLSGLELQHALSAKHDTLPIIFVTGHGDIPMTVSAMKAGAADFLAKPVDAAALLESIGTALERSANALANRGEIDLIQRRIDHLTPREREVLVLVVNGWLNKQVASELGTVEKTVKVHRARVMKKMEANSLAELVRLSDKAGVSTHRDTDRTRGQCVWPFGVGYVVVILLMC